MGSGYEKSDAYPGPSPRLFVLAACAVMIAVLCGFYCLSFG
jgi:hypothetical protein